MNPVDPNYDRQREIEYVPIPQQPPVVVPAVPIQSPPPVNQVAETNQAMQGDMRMQRGHRTYIDSNGNMVEREEQIFEDPKLARVNILDRTARILYFIIGLIEVLLLLRFLFRLLGAGNTGFVSMIYNLTSPLIIPLNGIFNDQSLSRMNVLEVSTLLAMVVWSLIGWGLVKLLYIVLEPSASTRSTFTTSRHRRLE
jgi:hypothetical protein